MNEAFLFALAGILLMPLVPAFIIYKFLPSKTSVSGPFKGLDVKLTGAFGGYFLLVLIATGVFFPILKNEQQDRIRELEQKLQAQAPAATETWKIIGHVQASIPEQTKVFFDDDMPAFPPTGDFELAKKCRIEDGKARIPKWICVYNKTDGYAVINLNRKPHSVDIDSFQVEFDTIGHTIAINKGIDIKSKRFDSLKYVGSLILQNPSISQNIAQTSPHLIQPELIAAAVKTHPELRKNAATLDLDIKRMQSGHPRPVSSPGR